LENELRIRKKWLLIFVNPRKGVCRVESGFYLSQIYDEIGLHKVVIIRVVGMVLNPMLCTCCYNYKKELGLGG